ESELPGSDGEARTGVRAVRIPRVGRVPRPTAYGRAPPGDRDAGDGPVHGTPGCPARRGRAACTVHHLDHAAAVSVGRVASGGPGCLRVACQGTRQLRPRVSDGARTR